MSLALRPRPGPVRPSRLVWRGSLEASGLWLDPALMGESALRDRILRRWRPGVRVRRVDRGVLLQFASPVRVATQDAPGLLLVEIGGALVAAPVTDAERQALEPRPGSVVLVRGGQAVVATPEGGPVDPSEWLDVDGWEVASVTSLGQPPRPPRSPMPPPRTARTILGPELVGEPSEETREVIAELMEAAQDRKREAEVLAGLQGEERRGARGGGAGRSAARGAPRGTVGGWLKDRLFDLIGLAGLGGLITRRQAKYIAAMMKMFETGDFGDALRHAIPLNGEAAAEAARAARGVPSPRENLELGAAAGAARNSLGLEDSLYDRLQRMYEQAADKLEEEGRYKEAAFVLLELLGRPDAAIALLERHELLAEAAALAEARELPPERVISLWLKADKPDEALRVARRFDAWGEAIVALERDEGSQSPRVHWLRSRWAAELRSAGDLAGAIQALWAMRDRAPQKRIAEILDEALEHEPVIPQLLARALAWEPYAEPRWERLRDLAVALLEDADELRRGEREAFAQELVAQTATPRTQVIARLAARAAVRDAHASELLPGPRRDRRLADHAGDRALVHDLRVPPPTGAQPFADSATAAELRIPPTGTGTAPVWDAALLPGGRMLVALGEAGCRLVDRRGRTVHAFDAPAHRLVVSDSGERAIFVADRGEFEATARADLRRRTVSPWADLGPGAFADNYDGSVWYAMQRGRLSALYVLSDGPLTALAEYPVDGVLAIRRKSTSLRVLRHDEDLGLECREYSIPKLTLRLRSARRPDQPPFDPSARWPWTLGEVELHPEGTRVDAHCQRSRGQPYKLRVTLLDTQGGSRRLQGDSLVLADGLGRVHVVSLLTGRIVRTLRV